MQKLSKNQKEEEENKMKIKDNKEIIIGFVVISLFIIMIIDEINSPRKEFGPEKPFIVDKTSITFNAFRPVAIIDFNLDLEGKQQHYFYVQEADNTVFMIERRIIVRRIEDGQFFAAKLRKQDLKLKRGQRIRLTLVQYWRSPTTLDEYLIAEPDTSK
jgi:hypothetical protein